MENEKVEVEGKENGDKNGKENYVEDVENCVVNGVESIQHPTVPTVSLLPAPSIEAAVMAGL